MSKQSFSYRAIYQSIIGSNHTLESIPFQYLKVPGTWYLLLVVAKKTEIDRKRHYLCTLPPAILFNAAPVSTIQHLTKHSLLYHSNNA